MAELMLKIGAGAGYEDGDILCAFNRRHIRCVHAQHLCHVKHAKLSSDGLREDGLAQQWRERTKQYRFERVSKTEVDRVPLAGGATERFGPGKIDVPLFVARRLRHARHAIFGIPGAEVWYGGDSDHSDAAMTQVWDHIEATTAYRESAFPLWPAGVEDLRVHLLIPTDDFTDVDAVEMEAPETKVVGDVEETIKRRRHHVNWKADIGFSAGDIAKAQDRRQSFDVRGRAPLSRVAIVKIKVAEIA